MAAVEHQAIVETQQERPGHSPMRSEPGNDGLLQRTGGHSVRNRFSTQQLTRMAVDDQCQRCPAVSPRPDTAQVFRPAFIRQLGHRCQGLYARPHASRPLAHLPAPDLEDALHRALVEPHVILHRFAIGLLQLLQLPLLLLSHIFGLGTQGVVHASFALFHSAFDFGG